MFTDPLSVTVSGSAKSLARIGSNDLRGMFNNIVAGIRLTISHTSGKRDRHVVRADFTKTADNEFLDGTASPVTMAVTLTCDVPKYGFSAAEQEANLQAVVDKLDEVGVLTKIINWES